MPGAGDEESVRELEDFYKSYHGSGVLNLPTEYPSSCLLGCVDVVGTPVAHVTSRGLSNSGPYDF